MRVGAVGSVCFCLWWGHQNDIQRRLNHLSGPQLLHLVTLHHVKNEDEANNVDDDSWDWLKIVFCVLYNIILSIVRCTQTKKLLQCVVQYHHVRSPGGALNIALQ